VYFAEFGNLKRVICRIIDAERSANYMFLNFYIQH